MTPFPWTDLVVIAGLVALNGLFAMSEIAIVTSRPERLHVLAARGQSGARAALTLVGEPGRFLSTVQAGLTLISIVTGAFSGANLGAPLGQRLAWLGLTPTLAPRAGFALAVTGTIAASLVIGELVPKQIGLRFAERIAVVVAPPMALIARIAAPLVWGLDRASMLLLWLVGVRGGQAGGVTAEEIDHIIAEASRSGALEEDERALMSGIMRLADRPVRALMTPRTRIEAIDRAAGAEVLRRTLARSRHALLPVSDGAPDRVVGVVRARDLLAQMVMGDAPDLDALMKRAEIIPDQLDAIDALRILQQAEVPMGLVHDEYGHLEGIVTRADLLAAILGDFASHRDEDEAPRLVAQEDGSWIIAGALSAEALADDLGLMLPDPCDYATAAGFALSILKRLPQAGDSFTEQGWRFEITRMEGRRIVTLRAVKCNPPGVPATTP